MIKTKDKKIRIEQNFKTIDFRNVAKISKLRKY